MTREEKLAASGQAIQDILRDMTDRRGFRALWDSLDGPTRIEIARTWEKYILNRLGVDA